MQHDPLVVATSPFRSLQYERIELSKFGILSTDQPINLNHSAYLLY